MKSTFITRAFALLLISILAGVTSAEPVKSSDIAGVYHGEGINFTLAAHPQYPGNRMIGMLISGDDQKVCAVTIKLGASGVSGIVYDGSLEKKLVIKIQVAGEVLTFSYADGTVQKLARVRNEENK